MATVHHSRIPAHHQVARRRLIVSGLVAPLAAASSPFHAACGKTPVMIAFAEWKRFTEEMLESPASPVSEADFEARVIQRLAMKQALFALPCESGTDSILKLLAYTDMGEDFIDDDNCTGASLLKEAAIMIGEAM